MSKMENVNEARFQEAVLDFEGLVLVDFWATWCAPCRMLAPTLEQVQDELSGKVKIVKVNIEESPSIASQYRIVNIPFMMLFKDGRQIGSLIGNQSKAKISGLIQNNL